MTGSADLLTAKEEIWELKMQNIIVTERWECLQRETASLKTVSHGTKESFSLQRQQALCLNTLFYFFAQASEEEIRKVQTLQDVWKHQVRHLCMAAINVANILSCLYLNPRPVTRYFQSLGTFLTLKA